MPASSWALIIQKIGPSGITAITASDVIQALYSTETHPVTINEDKIMQQNPINKSVYLLAIPMLIALLLSSCGDNARAQECKNMRKLIAAKSKEVVEISESQKPYARYNAQAIDLFKHTELEAQKAAINGKIDKLQQDVQIKCSK
jgi:hypothetical protein